MLNLKLLKGIKIRLAFDTRQVNKLENLRGHLQCHVTLFFDK